MTLFSMVDPGVILEEIVQHMEKELRRRGIHLRMDRRTPLPMVRLNLRQFRSSLQLVMEFFPVLLPRGGELEIAAGIREIDGEQYVEIGAVSSSTIFDVIRPFLQVGNHQAVLNIALARQILRRYRGRILFLKENPQRVAFTILLKVS